MVLVATRHLHQNARPYLTTGRAMFNQLTNIQYIDEKIVLPVIAFPRTRLSISDLI